MADLFAPLDGLLRCGGDPRLDIDPASGVNDIGASLCARGGSAEFPGAAQENLKSELAHVGAIVSKIEWLLAHLDDLNLMETSHAS